MPGEDEELAALYRKYANARAISEGLKTVYELTGNGMNGAGDGMGRAVRQLTRIAEYDDKLKDLLSQAADIEALLNDFNKDLSQYLSSMDSFEEEFYEVTKRLDLINHLKQKYGNSIEQIHAYMAECEEKLARYRDYDAYMERLRKSLEAERQRLEELSGRLSEIRKRRAKELTAKIRDALMSLNFLDVRFEMVFNEAAVIPQTDMTMRVHNFHQSVRDEISFQRGIRR